MSGWNGKLEVLCHGQNASKDHSAASTSPFIFIQALGHWSHNVIYTDLSYLCIWWGLCTLYLLVWQVTITVGDSGLCCCVRVTSVERQLIPFFVSSYNYDFYACICRNEKKKKNKSFVNSLSVCLFVCLFVCLSVCLYLCLSVCLSVSVSVSVSVYLSLS